MTDIKPIIHKGPERNFVKEFYENYGKFLIQKSKEFWQLILFDLLVALCNTKKNNKDFKLMCTNLINDEEAV